MDACSRNPAPQPRPDGLSHGDPVPLGLAGRNLAQRKDKTVLVMVGLPGTGKTHLSRRVARYLQFFHSVHIEMFTVADFRRREIGVSVPAAYFDQASAESRRQREWCWAQVFEELQDFLRGGPGSPRGGARPSTKDCARSGRLGIFDANNLSRELRRRVAKRMAEMQVRVVFVETIVTDPALLELEFRRVRERMPDYEGMSDDDLSRDYSQRCEYLRQTYEPLNTAGDEGHLSWVQITNMQTFVINRVSSYLSGQIVRFLLNLHSKKRVIYLSRHGQSEYNALQKIGGDSTLSSKGLEYSRRLAEFADEHISRNGAGEVIPSRLWTSTLRRTKETVSEIKSTPIVHKGLPFVCMRQQSWTNLDEIYAGVCDGMTYEEIAETYPEEAERRRENKLTYRYPRGESYMDLLQRLEPIVYEIERHEDPLLIVGHQAVLRVLYCYLRGIPREEAPRVSMPLHTVIKLTPHTYDCDEERFFLLGNAEGTADDAPSH